VWVNNSPPSGNADSECPVTNVNQPSREALIAIYQSDQTRISAIGSTTLTMLGAGLTYVVATLPFTQSLVRGIQQLSKHHAQIASGIFLYSLPSLLWVIAAYHCLLTLEAMARTVSARIIEQKLATYGQLNVGKHRDIAFGFEASDDVIAFGQQKFRHKLLTIIAYGGILCVICAYTIIMILLGGAYIWRMPAEITYGAIFLIVIYSWIRGIIATTKTQKDANLR
jgi:hypothetical protein